MGTALDTSNALLTLNQFKGFIGMSTTSSTYDSRLRDIIDAVSWRFNVETNRDLKSRSVTEYRDGDGTNEILTHQWPITSTTSLSVIIDPNRAYTTTLKVDSTSIIIYSTEGRIVLDDDTFDCGAQTVKMSYTGGYTPIPYDLQYAAKEYGRLLWNREKSNRIGVRSEMAEGGMITYEDDMPWSVRKVLDNYKRRDR